MEAALRDYTNSFNSLQSVSQVSIRLYCSVLYLVEEEGGRRGGGRGKGALCGSRLSSLALSHMCSAAADRIPASTG